MRYMFLIYDCEQHAPGGAEAAAQRDAVNSFIDLCIERGVYRGGDPLHTAEAATTVRVRDGETLITDGPFAETREQLGGYFVLDCRDMDEALDLAACCPFAAQGRVEVRPIREVPGMRRPAVDGIRPLAERER